MKDTTEKVQKELYKLIQEKTGEERLLMGCSMYDFAKELAISSLFKKNPNLSSKELKKELFLRFYEKDFTKDQRNKLLAKFSS